MTSSAEKNLPARPDFLFIGEHPAVDLANTLVVSDGHPADLLLSWADVVRWLSQAKLATDADLALPVAKAAQAFQHVIELRQGWGAALASLVAGGEVSEAFLSQLNRILAKDTFHETLARDNTKGFVLARSPMQGAGESLVLVTLARHIASFLAQANVSHLHRCANTASCVLYFYDTTKNHRRQWCSVATCGNRHKVAQFRQRQMKARK